MKYFICLFLIVGLYGCKSAKLEKHPPFQIIDPSYNNWVGGQPGISGIRIIMGYKSSEDIEFGKVYFQNKEGSLELYQREGKNYLIGDIRNGTRKQGDLILDIDPKQELKNSVPNIVEPPVELKSTEAAIVFIYKGKEYIFKVENLKQTPSDYYP